MGEFKMIGEKTAEVFIYQEIGGFFDGYDATDFKNELGKLGEVDEIVVRINSMGGSVFEGLAIYNLLREHSAKVTVKIDGIAASIASVIAMAGDEIVISESGFMMIHEPLVMTFGHERDHLNSAAMLAKIRDQAAGVYATREDVSREDALAMMQIDGGEGIWLTASEAMERGLVDSITDPDKSVAIAVDRKRFPKAPQAIGDIETKGEAAEAIRRIEIEAKEREIAIRMKILQIDADSDQLDQMMTVTHSPKYVISSDSGTS